jgi:hypothetical protein
MQESITVAHAEQPYAHALFEFLCGAVNEDGRVRAEDLIAAAASITGEFCIAAAGEFDPQRHDWAPGSRVLSQRVNQLFSGDESEALAAVPAESIVGLLREELLPAGYQESDFPALRMVFEHFVANIGKASDWGKVPLAVPEGNYPWVLPLRVAYEARPAVVRIFEPLKTPQERLRAAVLALAEVLIVTQQIMDRKTALLLALQIVNGMAKTAPMTDEAMHALKKKMDSEGK